MAVILETKRLVLRPFKTDDLETIYRYRNDIRCSKYQTWNDKTKSALKLFISSQKDKILGKGTIQLAIAKKDDNRIVGDVFLDFDVHTISLGYTIDYLYHRQGYGYEIISELLAYLTKNYNYKQVLARVFSNNHPSINLLVKLGFKKVGIIEKEDTIIYSYLLR